MNVTMSAYDAEKIGDMSISSSTYSNLGAAKITGDLSMNMKQAKNISIPQPHITGNAYIDTMNMKSVEINNYENF